MSLQKDAEVLDVNMRFSCVCVFVYVSLLFFLNYFLIEG